MRQPALQRLRILRISHSGVVPEYRERERALVRNHDVILELLVPHHWPHIGIDPQAINTEESFAIISGATYGTGSIPLFAYELPILIERLKDFKPDVIDIHEEPYSVSAFEIVVLAKRVCPASKIIIYSAQNIKKRYPPPFKWMERYVMDNVDAAYPCSQGVQDVLIAKGFAKPAPVIPLGVQTDLFLPKSHPISKSFTVGFAGRLEDSKGIDILIEAMALSQSNTNTFRLMICGSGSTESRLKSMAQVHGLNNVTWCGELTQAAMPAFYQGCDAFVVPSLTTKTWKEQFGRTAAEAMSCGIPVVVSDSGSLPEVVGDCGLVVPEGDAKALAKALQTISRDSSVRTNLSMQGRQRAVERYSWTAVAEQMFDLYQSALGAKYAPR